MEQPVSLSGIKAYLFDSPFEGKGMSRAFGWLGELDGLSVLDAGCGHGAFTVYAVSRGAGAVGLDVQMAGLVFAAAQSTGMKLPASFVCGRSEELPFPDGCFDLVLSRSTLQYTDIPAVNHELLRVLKPGGALVLVENMAHNPFLLLFRAFRRLRRNSLRLGKYAGNEAGVIRGYASVRRMRAILSGLRDGGCCFCHLFRPLTVGLVQLTGQARWALFLDRCMELLDGFLLGSIPPLRSLAWSGSIWGRKPAGNQARIPDTAAASIKYPSEPVDTP